MDDDRSQALNFEEFDKGLRDYGLNLDPEVSYKVLKWK